MHAEQQSEFVFFVIPMTCERVIFIAENFSTLSAVSSANFVETFKRLK